jgi:hypothetical protein
MIIDSVTEVLQRFVDNAGINRDAEQHEREFAALRQGERQRTRGRRRQAGEPAHRVQDSRLDRNQQRHQAQHAPRLVEQQAEVRGHADGDEEQTQQQAFEWLDVRLQFVAVLGIRQQHTGEKRAQRHRQTRGTHCERGAGNGQQRSRGEDFRHLGQRQDPQDRTQQVAAADHDEGQGADGLGRTQQRTAAGLDRLPCAQQRQQCEEGDHREVLEQQDGERGAAVVLCQLLALGEHLQDQRGGRHRQAKAGDQRGGRRLVLPPGNRREHRGGQQNLRAADAEHRVAQAPQARQLQFQPDYEQQQHHAELREVENLVNVADQAQAPRADRDAASQVAEYRAEAQALEHRYGDHRRSEEQRKVGKHGIKFTGLGPCTAWRRGSLSTSAKKIGSAGCGNGFP